MCGENDLRRIHASLIEGSPPRVRGKRAVAPQVRGPEGLTPACAGKTTAGANREHERTAHPRVCGENHRVEPRRRALTGSPPRVRGKLRTCECHRLPRPAHPRVCGENPCRSHGDGATCGSPPRVRGKLRIVKATLADFGLTPACAGKTGPTRSPRSDSEAHPRVCGENPEIRIVYIHNMWLTPACAGKTNL